MLYIYIYVIYVYVIQQIGEMVHGALTLLKVKFRSLLFVDLALKYYRKVNITRPVEKKDLKMLNMHRSIKFNDKFRWG